MDDRTEIERQSMEVDIACVGFGPATAGFLTELSRGLTDDSGQPVLESKVMPGMPLQVVCYERADDIGFGVSGIATRARAISESFPGVDLKQIPMSQPVTKEKVLYLLDPVGASRRSWPVRMADRLIRAFRFMLPVEDHALAMPYIPPFLRKDGGMLMSVGQLSQWAGASLMGSGMVQIWPGMPVAGPLFEGDDVVGVRLVDQGTDREGNPEAGYMPGMDIRAALTVVGDGPVGPVGRQIDERVGMPPGHARNHWALGMKMLVDLPKSCPLEPGTVLHTFGYPEPEIFGFLYVYPDNVASLGIFVPSWWDCPIRTSYRYLHHWMMHPYLHRYLKGGTLRSWGAKTLGEAGRRGEPHLAGNGYARIGEGSGTTNVLTGSGVDEAWKSGALLAEGVKELARQDKKFTRENLEATYVARRRDTWLEKEAQVAERARDGFERGFVRGLLGMALTGMTGGRLNLSGASASSSKSLPTVEEYYKGRISKEEIESIRKQAAAAGTSLHDGLMNSCGWPEIPYDGKLFLSHQDALLVGGKVQAPPGFADHVAFLDQTLCRSCGIKLCIEVCSGQAITPGEDGVPQFDREKCIHCGACEWSCTQRRDGETGRGNIEFRAGAGGLHSAEN